MLSPQAEEMKHLSQNTESDQTHALQQDVDIPAPAQHYGNIKILSTKYVHLSVGPDSIIFLSGMSYGMYIIQYLIQLQFWQTFFHYLFIILPPVLFLMTMLSNPGIYNPQQNFQPKRKFCNACKFFIPKSVYHCKYCNVCIEEYDHHCPWLSKCVGKNNLKLFYAFIVSIPATFFYFCYLIYMLVETQDQKHAQTHSH